MADEDYKRKLTNIYSVDTKGYSLLMADNAIATIETITSHRKTRKSLIDLQSISTVIGNILRK